LRSPPQRCRTSAAFVHWHASRPLDAATPSNDPRSGCIVRVGGGVSPVCLTSQHLTALYIYIIYLYLFIHTSIIYIYINYLYIQIHIPTVHLYRHGAEHLVELASDRHHHRANVLQTRNEWLAGAVHSLQSFVPLAGIGDQAGSRVVFYRWQSIKIATRSTIARRAVREDVNHVAVDRGHYGVLISHVVDSNDLFDLRTIGFPVVS